MKTLYVNSRLHPLLLGKPEIGKSREWIFSLGEPWLLLTPQRLQNLAMRLGLGDGRIHRLIGLVRRHAEQPETYCRRLGIRESLHFAPAEYPFALCPRCDGVHYPHPEDTNKVCQDCRNKEHDEERLHPGGGAILDRRLDKLARRALRRNEPRSFNSAGLSPNHRINQRRRVERDWEKAAHCIMLGLTYRRVSKEFDCSVGLLHRKVHERPWENN